MKYTFRVEVSDVMVDVLHQDDRLAEDLSEAVKVGVNRISWDDNREDDAVVTVRDRDGVYIGLLHIERTHS